MYANLTRLRANWRKQRLKSRARKEQMIREAKAKACADCGRSYPYYVMQFDHRSDLAKLADVSKMAKEANRSCYYRSTAKNYGRACRHS